MHRPERYRAGQVLYTGTHDNDTLRGWYETLPPASVALVREAGVGAREPWWGLMELALSSKPRLCMLQVQDVLGLGSEARMNAPGVAGGQWRWRLRDRAAHAGVGAAVAAAHSGRRPVAVGARGTACAYSITEGKESAAAPGLRRRWCPNCLGIGTLARFTDPIRGSSARAGLRRHTLSLGDAVSAAQCRERGRRRRQAAAAGARWPTSVQKASTTPG